jgi:hypothetical protein
MTPYNPNTEFPTLWIKDVDFGPSITAIYILRFIPNICEKNGSPHTALI